MLKKIVAAVFMIFALESIVCSQSKNKDTYIFMDISGSVYPSFKKMQDYAISEIMPDIKKETHLSIYKFYGKCVNIYDKEVMSDFDIKYAEQRISELLPNGPWTNLDLVKSTIEELNINLETATVYILTDGHQEKKDGLNEYFLTQSNINSFLENCDLFQKDGWFLLVYRHKEKVLESAPVQPPVQIDVAEKITETKEKRQLKMDWLKIALRMLFVIALLIFLIDVVTYCIFCRGKKKSVKLQLFSEYCFRWMPYAFLYVVLLVLFAVVLIAALPVVLAFSISIVLTAGLAILIYKRSLKNIRKNIFFSIKIKSLSAYLKKDTYVEIALKYSIPAKDCNSVLFLRRKGIDDIEFSGQNVQEQQIVLGLALKKINDCFAVGFQKFSEFYFINLEAIFKQLNIEFSLEERKKIASAIANSYGNLKLDKWDWLLGVGIGIITGLIDVFLVGEPGDSKLGNLVDKLYEKCTLIAAKIAGYKGDSLSGAVAYLEKKGYVTYDKADNKEIGMNTKNHHLISLAHANDVIGLLFSIVDTMDSIKLSKENGGELWTVVTVIDHGTIRRIEEPLLFAKGERKDETKTIDDLAKNVTFRVLYKKCENAEDFETTVLCIIYGFVIWFLHLASDQIGSSGTVKKGNRGTGIAAPFQELAALISVKIPVFKEGEEIIEKTFGDIAKEMFEHGFDNRFYQTQKIPVILNEYLSKIAFIFKEIAVYDKEFPIEEVIQLLFAREANFELKKMLLVSFSTFSTMDVVEAIMEKGWGKSALLRINYPGLIKCAKTGVSVFFSYFHRWTASPDKIVKQIKDVANEIVEDEKEEDESNEVQHS